MSSGMVRQVSCDPADSRLTKLRKARAYATSCGLSRSERIDLAEIILRRDVASWSDLTEAQVERLLDAFEGLALLRHLLDSRQH